MTWLAFRAGLYGRLVSRYRHSKVARSTTKPAQLLLADLVGRIDRLRLAKIGDRVLLATQRLVGKAAVVVGLDIIGIELDRLGEIRDGAVEPADGGVSP